MPDIPENITKEHLLKAIKKIDRDGVPPHLQSRQYDVVYNGKKYPPKLIVSWANEFANGKALDHNDFNGGRNTECFNLLEISGFSVVEKERTGENQTENSAESRVISEKNLQAPLNQILYGPPGTGKTYATIEKALAILKPDFLTQQPTRADMKAEFDSLLEDGRIHFCTFHQSFSYEDFVEGLRAEVNEETKQLEYRVQDGVFKELALQAKSRATLAENGLNALDLTERRVWKMSLGNTQSNQGVVAN